MTSTPLHPPFGAVTVDVVRWPRMPAPPMPVGWLSREQKAAELARLQGEKAMRAAYEAELILGLADDTPELPEDHPAAGTSSWAPDRELPGVDESFSQELSMILNCGRRTASVKAARAWVFRQSLPATWAALRSGALDESRAYALVDVLEHTTAEVARRVEAAVLPEAVDLPVGRLKKRALQLLIAYDAEAVDERREQAERQADVTVYPSAREGMATLAAELPAPVAAECFDLVDQLAVMLKTDGDGRPIGQLRAEVFADLIRRPWDTSLPVVSARLHLFASLDALAGRSSEAGEVNGLPITGAHLRELLARLHALRTDHHVNVPAGTTVAVTDADGALRATVSVTQLQRLVQRGCPAHPRGDCDCPLLQAPPATEAYEPTAAQRAWVKTRDRTCRMPNCGQRVGWADLDHVLAHACGGETTCTNLCCLCRSHHRLKTRRTDWQFRMHPDGTLQVTTPSGITRTTRPPSLRPPRIEPPPSEPPPDADSPPPQTDFLDDPPPF